MKKFYVYKITCLCDEWKGMYYIGSHYGKLDDSYAGRGVKIQEYFKKYGKKNTYKRTILAIGTQENIAELEKSYIKKHINKRKCLNKIVAGNGLTFFGKTHVMSDEQKAKISVRMKGVKRGPFTEEHKRKLSKSHKGSKLPEEAKIKIGKAHKGKIVSDETKEKMRLAHTGKHHSEKTKSKISKSLRKSAA